MTKARMNWGKLRLEMSGHAGAAERGKDIVCAAESMLTQALLQTLLEMNDEKKLWMEWTGSAAAGYLKMEAAPVEEYRAEVRACFRMCITGLRMLAEKYPEHIKLTEEGNEHGNL